MDFKIAGKIALVCAASKGLGRAIALALADEGVELMLCARSQDELEMVAKEARKRSGKDAHIFSCDLSQVKDRIQLIEEVQKKVEFVDILIHNTGGPKPTTVESTTLEDWDAGYQQLFPAVAHLNLTFLPGMKERKWGRIVAVTSLSVLEPIANLAISNAMRSAVVAMLKTLSDEVAKFNVTVNCLAPGLIHTGRTESLMEARMQKSGQTKDEYIAEYVKPIPAGRLGTPEEFAAAAAFLCSEQASYITGSTLCIDGGKRRSTY